MTAALSLGLAGMALLVAAGSPGRADRVDSLLQQVAQMEPVDQQRFLLWIESRFTRAHRIVLRSDEAAAAGASLRAGLHRETVSWAALRSLLVELDRRENQAIEQLTRGYRLQTYRTFQNARDAYHQRQQAWFDVWAAWQAAGRPLAHQHELLDWLAAAIYRSGPDTAAALPAAPRFESRSLAALLSAATIRTNPPPADFRVPEVDPFGEPSPPVASTAPRDPLVPVKPAVPESDIFAARSLEPASRAIREHVAAIVVHQVLPIPDVPAVVPQTSGLIGPRRPAPPTASGPSPWLAGSVPRQTAPLNVPAFSGGAMPNKPVSPSAPVGMKLVAGTEPAERPAASRPTLPDPPTLPPTTIPAGEGTIGIARPDHSPLAVEPATLSRGMAQAMPRRARQTRLGELVDAGTSRGDPGDGWPSHAGGGVNLGELRSRIAGTNMALRALESELDEPRHWNAGELAPRIVRLHALTLRVEDMRLFREMVPEELRRLIDAGDSPQPAITLLAARIAEARRQAAAASYPGTEAERQAELTKLSDLSRRLVEVAGLMSP